MSHYPTIKKQPWINTTIWGNMSAAVINVTYIFSDLTDMQSGYEVLPIPCCSLRCSLTRQEGTLNFTHARLLAKGGGLLMVRHSKTRKSRFAPGWEHWQTKLDYRPPRIGMPGLAGGLGSLNYSITNYFQTRIPTGIAPRGFRQQVRLRIGRDPPDNVQRRSHEYHQRSQPLQLLYKRTRR
jgi:hypothetical protein